MCLSKTNDKLEFSVRNMWESIRVEGAEIPWTKLVWSYYCIPKHSFLLWLVLGKNLKTQDKMKVWDGVRRFSKGCLLCQQSEETHDHIFFECSYFRAVWFD